MNPPPLPVLQELPERSRVVVEACWNWGCRQRLFLVRMRTMVRNRVHTVVARQRNLERPRYLPAARLSRQSG